MGVGWSTNRGSFFKNPILDAACYHQLKNRFSKMPSYPISQEAFKIPAGWLIEQAGFKGKRFGTCGVHKNQALVLVNYGAAKGSTILRLAQNIQEVVLQRFGVRLDTEVNIF